MDKLLSANRRLQAFIDQPQQQGQPMRSPSAMSMNVSMSGLQASPAGAGGSGSGSGGGGGARAPTPGAGAAAVFSASAAPSRRTSISAAVTPSFAYNSPQQRAVPADRDREGHSSVAVAVPFDSTFAGAAAP